MATSALLLLPPPALVQLEVLGMFRESISPCLTSESMSLHFMCLKVLGKQDANMSSRMRIYFHPIATRHS